MRVKNWSKFQHYQDRKPTWIKLYRDLLDNRDWFELTGIEAKVLTMLWLLACEYDDGVLPEIKTLSFRLRTPESELEKVLEVLVERGFIEDTDKEPIKITNKIKAEKAGFGSRYIKDSTKREVRQRDKNRCVNCESTKNIEFDHILPVSKGGNSEIDNIQLLCRSCNRAKRNKLLRKAQGLRSLEKETEKETESEAETESERAGANINSAALDDLNRIRFTDKSSSVDPKALSLILAEYSTEIKFANQNSKNLHHVETALETFSADQIREAIKKMAHKYKIENTFQRFRRSPEAFFDPDHIRHILSDSFVIDEPVSKPESTLTDGQRWLKDKRAELRGHCVTQSSGEISPIDALDTIESYLERWRYGLKPKLAERWLRALTGTNKKAISRAFNDLMLGAEKPFTFKQLSELSLKYMDDNEALRNIEIWKEELKKEV